MKRLQNNTLTYTLLFLFIPSVLFAQKVGLVLSGGGSKGVAHIGVIKALEENDIPIDYITGTSMGAIIGGFYAAGYTPEEMEDIIASEEFRVWVSGKVNEKYRYYFKEPDPTSSWVNFRFNYEDNRLRTKLPTNLISPLYMDFAFMELFASASASAHYDFDKLMVPFRCVAADIQNNQPVVLEDGNLGQAIRASMTFPFYFRPVSIDGKLLFDGGMYNNFPSDVMMDEFKPDVIIGSKAASNYGPPREDNLLSQIQTMLMENTDYNTILEKSILIEPDLPSINLTNFSYSDRFIDSGYVSTIKSIGQIKELISRRVDSTKREQLRNNFNAKKPPILIDSIVTKGITNNQSQYVRTVLRSELSRNDEDRLLSIDELKPAYYKLVADDKVEMLYPLLKYDYRKNLYDLHIDVKKESNMVVGIGGNISSRAMNEIFLQVQYNHWRKRSLTLAANAYFGRFYNSGQFRARWDLSATFPYYLEGIYTYNNFNFFKTTTYFFEDEKPSYLVQNENLVELNMGFPTTYQGKIVLGATGGLLRDDYYQTNVFSRLDTADRTKFNCISPHLLFEINTLNKKQYASGGVCFRITGRYINGMESTLPGSTLISENEIEKHHEWFQANLLYDNYFERLGILKLGFYGEVMLSTQTLFSNYISTTLSSPAFQPFPESKTLFLPQYRAHNFAGAGLKNVYRIHKNLDFRIEGYIFQPFREIIKKPDFTAEYGDLFEDRLFLGTSALVYHSPLGPVSMSLSYFDKNDEEPFLFMINIGYLIFNKRACK